MNTEFAKLVNWLNTRFATFNAEKLINRIEDLRSSGNCKIYQCPIGKALTHSTASVVEYMSDVKLKHNVLLTSTDTQVQHLVLDDILFMLRMSGFTRDLS